LPSAGIIGNCDHDKGNAVLSIGSDRFFQFIDIDVALEGVLQIRLVGFFDDTIDGFCADVEDMASRRIEGHVEGNPVSRLGQRAEQDVLRSSSLVTGNDEVKSEDFLDGLFQGVVTVCARIGLIAPHQGSPLVLAHCSGAGIGKKVDVNIG
jgi:hypothetical protein